MAMKATRAGTVSKPSQPSGGKQMPRVGGHTTNKTSGPGVGGGFGGKGGSSC